MMNRPYNHDASYERYLIGYSAGLRDEAEPLDSDGRHGWRAGRRDALASEARRQLATLPGDANAMVTSDGTILSCNG